MVNKFTMLLRYILMYRVICAWPVYLLYHVS